MKFVLPILRLFYSSILLFVLFISTKQVVFAESTDPNKDFKFNATTGSAPGTVELTWIDKDYVESYNIAYGDAAGNYRFGVTNIGNISSYTIGGLTQGQVYYFVLSPIDDGHAQAFTTETMAQAGGPSIKRVQATVESQKQSVSKDTSKNIYQQTSQTLPSGTPEDKNFHLQAVPGTTSGTVKLTWDNKGYTETYNIVYGPSSGNYIWGVANLGHIGEFTVGRLTPGQRYYFILSPVDDGVAFPYSPYVSAIASP